MGATVVGVNGHDVGAGASGDPPATRLIDRLDLLSKKLYIELLVGDAGSVGKMVTIGIVGFTVILGSLVKEAAGNSQFEILEGHGTFLILCHFAVGEILFHALPFGIGKSPVGIEGTLEVGEVDPRGDGGFEERYVFTVAVGVVTEVGVAGFDEYDGFQAQFSEDRGEEDTCVDAIGLTGIEDFVEEAYVLNIGAWRGVGGTGDGGVSDAVVEGVIPYGEDLVAYGLSGTGLVAGET